MMLLLLLAILLVIVCYRHNRPLQKIPIEELHLREMFVIAIGLLMLMYVSITEKYSTGCHPTKSALTLP